MRTICLVFLNNLKRALQDKLKFAINIIFPLLSIILAMFANSVGTASINIAVIENVKNEETERITSMLKETKGIKITNTTDKLLMTDMITGRYDGVITFTGEFEKNTIENVQDYADFYSVKNKDIVQGMKDVVLAYNHTDDVMELDDVTDEFNSDTLSKTQRMLSFLAMVLIITSVINGSVIIKDKYENTLLRYLYTPNTKLQYILGNGLYCFLISYIEFFLSIVIVQIIGVELGIAMPILLILGLIISVVCTNLGVLIAALFNKEMHASIYAGAIGLILTLVGGAFISYDMMPKGMKFASNLTPIRWIIQEVGLIEQNGNLQIQSIIILLIFAIVFAIVAAMLNMSKKITL